MYFDALGPRYYDDNMQEMEEFYDFIIKSHSFNGPKTWPCDLQKCFVSFFPPEVRQEE